METKYICVIGSVISSLGKGVAAASIAKLLKLQGYKIAQIKIDGYMNVDCGVMSPQEHGEAYVTDDGGEIDLDFGTYERFTDVNMSVNSSITSGKLYSEMLEKERNGDYLGRTVQLIPHYTDNINEKILNIGKDHDVVIIEVGGSIGDMESDVFIEALRQLRNKVGKENMLYFILTYIPFLKTTQELKTKLAQQSLKTVRQYGLKSDILFCRTEKPLNENIINKISTMGDIPAEDIFEGLDADDIYEIPCVMHDQKLDKRICEKLNLNYKEDVLDNWNNFIYKKSLINENITIGLVGKYIELHDAYLSVSESLKHAGWNNKVNVNIEWIDAEKVEEDITYLQNFKLNGIIIPGGFGTRGISGKIMAINYAREMKIPLLGICLGMQLMAIEFVKNVCNIKEATSEEFDEENKSNAHIIHIMEEQKKVNQKGGTMRLGAYPCVLKNNTKAKDAYKETNISERHRHRYEFNNDYKELLEKNGMTISGTSPNGNLVEMIELNDHPFFVGCQFHPEFKSRPDKAHPLFNDFIFYSKNIKRVIKK